MEKTKTVEAKTSRLAKKGFLHTTLREKDRRVDYYSEGRTLSQTKEKGKLQVARDEEKAKVTKRLPFWLRRKFTAPPLVFICPLINPSPF
jgi:predicted transcriptional regulator